jgi:hypothetical protein
MEGDDLGELKKQEALLDEQVKGAIEPLHRIHIQLQQVRNAYAALVAKARGDDVQDAVFLACALEHLNAIGQELEIINRNFSAEVEKLNLAEQELARTRRRILMATVH